MTQKTRKTLMALVGAYLVYTGIELILDVTRNNPKNMIGFMLVGLFFVAFGAVTAVWNVKGFIAESKKEQEEQQAEGDSEEASEEDAEEEDAEDEDAEDSEVELDEDAQPVDKEGDE